MSESALQILRTIEDRIDATIRRITLSELLTGVALVISILSAAWLLLSGMEAGFWLSTTIRSVLFWSLAVGIAVLSIRSIAMPLLRHLGIIGRPPKDEVADRIGSQYPEISDKMVNLLHLGRGEHSPSSRQLVSEAVTVLGQQIEPVKFEKVESFEKPIKVGRWALGGVALLAVFLLAAPTTFVNASKRLLTPTTEYLKPASFAFVVAPGSIELLKGESMSVRASAAGTNLPTEAVLAFQARDEERVESITMKPDSLSSAEQPGFEHTFVNVRKPFRYRVEAGSVVSAWSEVSVLERPLVASLQVSLDFPRYAGIPRQILDSDVGDVTALRGTFVSYDIRVAGPQLSVAYIEHDNGKIDTLSVAGDKVTGSFRVRRSGSYHVVLESDRGIRNDSPITYKVRTLDDGFPSIVILEPEPTYELTDESTVSVLARISDDFGFRDLKLTYRLVESRFGSVDSVFHSIDLPIPATRRLLQEVPYNWSLGTTLDTTPVPGDVVEYYLELRDNDSYSGFKEARTGMYKIVVPSLADKIESLDELEDNAEESLEQLLEDSQEMREQFDELREELQQNPEADWDDERQLNQLRNQQEQMTQRAEDLANQIQEMTEQMEEDQLVSPETKELFEELQRVVEEINSEELEQSLNELQQAMQNMDMQQMQQALENFEFNENQYQERLQRSLDLLKKLEVQQDLDEVAKLAEDLAERQEKLAEETEKLQDESESNEDGEPKDGEPKDGEPNDGEPKDGEPKDGEQGSEQDGEEGGEQGGENQDSEAKSPEELAREQERAAEDMQKLEERLEEIQEQMRDAKNTPSGEMEELSQSVERQNLPERMKENAEQLKQNQLQPAQQGQQQMSQELKSMQQQLSEMQQGMQGMQMQVDMAGLRQSLNDVLILSEQQESLKDKLSATNVDGGTLRSFAREQLRVEEGFRVVKDSLVSLSSRIPQMSSMIQSESSEALREMGGATTAMAERVVRRATGHQRSAMTHLNELALLLSDLLSSMNNSNNQSGGGQSLEQMMNQMQQMSQSQGQLNNEIQQLLNDMAGQRLTNDMEARMRQLAGRQEALRRELRELSRNPELRGKALGDLAKIAQQMEETIKELQTRRAGRRTVERQQQIMTRMLEATQSLQERGKDNKRESKSGEELRRLSPEDLPESERLDALRRDLIRALEVGYSPDYEELIKRYFDLLQKQ